MSLADRVRIALEQGHRRRPVLLAGDVLEGEEIERGTTPAAVLVPIVERAHPTVILTLRPHTMRRHPGQVSFPGGRIDPDDRGPVEAALREAEEEIALPRGAVDVVGTGDRYRTITGFEVIPVVGIVPPDLPLRPQPDEVADLFEVPLDFLLDPAHHQVKKVHFQGKERCYFEIEHGGRRIWGATAAMIVNLSRRLRAEDEGS